MLAIICNVADAILALLDFITKVAVFLVCVNHDALANTLQLHDEGGVLRGSLRSGRNFKPNCC